MAKSRVIFLFFVALLVAFTSCADVGSDTSGRKVAKSPSPILQVATTTIKQHTPVVTARKAPVVTTRKASPTAALKKTQMTHVFRNGDTLWSLAEDFLGSGSRWEELAAINGINDPSSISNGTIIRFPIWEEVEQSLNTKKEVAPISTHSPSFGGDVVFTSPATQADFSTGLPGAFSGGLSGGLSTDFSGGCSWGYYENSSGDCIREPTRSRLFGWTARCNDGYYSYSATNSGTCSGHRGVDYFKGDSLVPSLTLPPLPTVPKLKLSVPSYSWSPPTVPSFTLPSYGGSSFDNSYFGGSSFDNPYFDNSLWP